MLHWLSPKRVLLKSRDRFKITSIEEVLKEENKSRMLIWLKKSCFNLQSRQIIFNGRGWLQKTVARNDPDKYAEEIMSIYDELFQE